MGQIGPELAGHPDRLKWNARYGGGYVPSFSAHPLGALALSMALPDGPVLDLASGPSGSALLAAAAGRPVTAVDASDVALGLLDDEAARRGLAGLITLVHADLSGWRPQRESFALVLCTGYWDESVFEAATGAVGRGGLLGWEAFTQAARADRPHVPSRWCLRPGEPASLLTPDFEVVFQRDAAGSGARRQLLARRCSTPVPADG